MRNPIIHKFLAISFSMVYLFFVVMYILIMPPINHPVKANVPPHTEFLVKAGSTSNTTNILQRGLRTNIINKQRVIVPATTACIILFFLVISALALLDLTKRSGVYLKIYQSQQFNTYLSLRVIRI